MWEFVRFWVCWDILSSKNNNVQLSAIPNINLWYLPNSQVISHIYLSRWFCSNSIDILILVHYKKVFSIILYRWTYKKAAVLEWHIDKCAIEDMEKTTPYKRNSCIWRISTLTGLSTCRNFKQWNSFWTKNLWIFIVIFFWEYCSAILKK